MTIVIHHNPDCGTSRNVLEIIRAAGYEPTVIEYLANCVVSDFAASPPASCQALLRRSR